MSARGTLLTGILGLTLMAALPTWAEDDDRGTAAINVGDTWQPDNSWFNWSDSANALTAELARENAAKVDRAVGNKAGMPSVIHKTMSNTQTHMGRGLMSLQMRQFRQAGGFFLNPEISIDVAYSSLEVTDMDIGGDVVEQSVTLESGLGQAVHAGLTFSASRIVLRGPLGGELGTQGVDAYVDVELSEHVSAGCFATGNAIDVEEFNGNGSMVGGGLTLSAVAGIGPTDLILTSALSRHMGDIVTREYDTHASALVDVQTKWSDMVSTSAHAFFSDSLSQSRAGEGDRTFGSVGVGVLLAPNDRIGLTFGVDRTVALKEVRDYRIHASIRFAW